MPMTAEKTGVAAFLPQVPKGPHTPREKTDQPKPRQRAKQTRKTRQSAVQTVASPALASTLPKGMETEESKRAKTVRLAQARMVNALRSVRLIGNLSARNYVWADGEVARMQAVLLEAVHETFAKFGTTGRKKKLEEMFLLDASNASGK